MVINCNGNRKSSSLVAMWCLCLLIFTFNIDVSLQTRPFYSGNNVPSTPISKEKDIAFHALSILAILGYADGGSNTNSNSRDGNLFYKRNSEISNALLGMPYLDAAGRRRRRR